MDNGTGNRGEAWVQLIREVIASWPLVFRTAVLMLTFSPVAAAVTLVQARRFGTATRAASDPWSW